jgi:hypothetical protein
MNIAVAPESLVIAPEFPEKFEHFFDDYRYKAFHGGRGSAKSWTVGRGLLIEGVMKPLRIVGAREIQKSIAQSVKTLLDDQIAAMGLQDFYTIFRDRITGANGTSFQFTGLSDLTNDQIKSFEGVDRFWVEEAQTLSQHSLEILRPTIRKPGSQLLFTWNPRDASDAVDMYFRGENPPPSSLIVQVNYNDNPFFPPALEEERKHDYEFNSDRYGHIWLGEYEPTVQGAIWSKQVLNACRVKEHPVLTRIIVAVDPSVSDSQTSDDNGIMVVGLGDNNRAYLLEDASCDGGPMTWASRAVAVHDKYQADAIVIETNQGGDMCKQTIKSVRNGIRVIEVKATRGKHVRAEPISAQYHLGNVHHVGTFPELENQLCKITPKGYEGKGSPDRADALVWALTELFPTISSKPVKMPQRRKRARSWRTV